MVESALLTVKESHVYALFDGSGMDSWEIDAVKDYFNLLKEHRVQFEKVAIVGNNIWHKVFAKLGEYFMAGEVRYFTDPHEAAAWIHE
jgi:hypothetical protein